MTTCVASCELNLEISLFNYVHCTGLESAHSSCFKILHLSHSKSATCHCSEVGGGVRVEGVFKLSFSVYPRLCMFSSFDFQTL